MGDVESIFDSLYKPVLEEYYDDMIDLSDLTFAESVERLISYETEAADRLQ